MKDTNTENRATMEIIFNGSLYSGNPSYTENAELDLLNQTEITLEP